MVDNLDGQLEEFALERVSAVESKVSESAYSMNFDFPIDLVVAQQLKDARDVVVEVQLNLIRLTVRKIRNDTTSHPSADLLFNFERVLQILAHLHDVEHLRASIDESIHYCETVFGHSIGLLEQLNYEQDDVVSHRLLDHQANFYQNSLNNAAKVVLKAEDMIARIFLRHRLGQLGDERHKKIVVSFSGDKTAVLHE